ncbi:MAG: non-ribosomal peptide synthetase, partial [bacterium]|nr:non-ribosomal peptide synthetase [bacterium]
PLEAFYRTGDQARWRPGGIIEFLGRIDQQVKIRGFRIEPGEIKNRLIEHDGVGDAVVMDREDENKVKYICAYIIPARNDDFDELTRQLRNHLTGQLPGYMIPSYFVEIAQIPLTPNGKVDRRALPEPQTGGINGTYTPPGNEIEEKLQEIWCETIGAKKNELGIDANFFEVGGHSLNATLMVSKIHKELKIKLALAEVFKTPTIRGQAQIIAGSHDETFHTIEPAVQKEYYPLSSAQKRMYVINQLNSESTVYNMPAVMTLEGKPDKDKLERVLRQLLVRHEGFRTAFKMVKGDPVQEIKKNVEFKLQYHEGLTSTTDPSTELAAFIRPFHLDRPPLLRVGLIKIRENEHLLMVDMPHIVSDGTSMGVLIKDFMLLVAGEHLAPINIHYKDYSEWQNQTKE